MEVGLAKQADERPSTMLEVQVYLTEALNELSENAEDDDIPFLSHNFVAPEHKPSSLKEQFSKDHENDKISPRQITQQLVAIQALPDPDEINMQPPAQESNAVDLSLHDDDPDSPFLQLPSIREDQLRKQEVVRRPANEKRMLARLQTDDPKSYQHTHFATATSRPPNSLENHLPFAPFSHSEKHQVFQPTHRTTGSNLVFQDPSKRSRTALQTLPAPRETPGEQSLNRLQFILFGIIGLLLFLIVFAISQPKKKRTAPQRPLSSIPKTKTTTQPKNLKDIGYLNISCLPKNARVLIGSKTRVLCPTSLLLLPKGLHHLVISKKGYKSQELYVKINSKRTSSIHILLRK
tara:strand:- start:2273 stop:3319 length:1047 start_codon:yes stop_codon:yes gene_type:complete